MQNVNEILKETVNRYKKDSLAVDSNDTVNSLTVSEQIEKLIKESYLRPETIGLMLSEGLDDTKSERYYIMLAIKHPSGRLLEAMSLTKDAQRRNAIRSNKAIYFQGILKRWGLQTKFKTRELN